ncbi:MAG: hypothetical protein FI688_03035 [SAR202 cluster bacterium]|nr:hypothetical protein [SAR202 cluster bacterium]|tara:strand:- start:5741 stop:6634 length:894 start_codon:yes stop_codon:yes gene_type:complete
METFSFIDLTSIHGRLKLCGDDKVDLLDRLSTNDISKLSELGQGMSTVLTTNKGRIIDLLKVYYFADHLMLISDMESINKVSEWIEFYTIMEDVTQVVISDETFQIRIFSDQPQAIFSEIENYETDDFFIGNLNGVEVAVISNKMNQKNCIDIIGQLSDKKIIVEYLKTHGTQLDSDQFENIRISLGYPKFGTELTEEFNPLEALLIDHISFNKGCYIGQEVVARLNTYDKVQRQMVKLSGETELQLGDLKFQGNVVGKITSVFNHEGIGFIKKNVLANTNQLELNESIVEINPIKS